MPMNNTYIFNPIDEKENKTKKIIESETLSDKSTTEKTLKIIPKFMSPPEFLAKKDSSTEKSANNSDEIVSKIIEIKQKEQELNHAKEDLFSNTNKIGKDKISEDLENDKSKYNI